MQYITRKQINLIIQETSCSPCISGELPYRLQHDRFEYLTVFEASSFFGFVPSDFKDFFETYPEKIPHVFLSGRIAFERNALVVWYAHTTLPILREVSKN
jgi:hypothetical protein